MNGLQVAKGHSQSTDKSFGGTGPQPGLGGTVPLGVSLEQQMLLDGKGNIQLRQHYWLDWAFASSCRTDGDNAMHLWLHMMTYK